MNLTFYQASKEYQSCMGGWGTAYSDPVTAEIRPWDTQEATRIVTRARAILRPRLDVELAKKEHREVDNRMAGTLTRIGSGELHWIGNGIRADAAAVLASTCGYDNAGPELTLEISHPSDNIDSMPDVPSAAIRALLSLYRKGGLRVRDNIRLMDTFSNQSEGVRYRLQCLLHLFDRTLR